MKKTLFILPSLAGGGAERVCINLVNNLRLQGAVDLVVVKEKGELLNSAPVNTFFLHGSFFNKIRQLRVLSKDYDVVVGSLELKGYFWAWFAVMNRPTRLLLWLHKDLVGYFGYVSKIKAVLYNVCLRLILRRADRLVCVSKQALNNFRKIYPHSEKRTFYCYNPMNFKSISDLSKKLEEPIPKDYFLAVGRLEFQKGFDYLIEAYKVAKDKGLSTPLLILGDGSLRSSLQKKIDELGLSDDISLLGFKLPYPYIKNAKALLLTSRMEALPTVLIEATFLETPFIAFDCHSGPKEIVEYFNSGMVVEDKNITDFSEAICSFQEGMVKTSLDMKKLEIFSQEEAAIRWLEVID